MRAMRLGWLALVGVVGVAAADRKPTQDEQLGAQLASYQENGANVALQTVGRDAPAPLFVFTNRGTAVNAWGRRWTGGSFGEFAEMRGKPTVAYAADRTIAWVAVDSHELFNCTTSMPVEQGDAFPCDPDQIVERDGHTHMVGPSAHMTGLFVKAKQGWVPYAYHVGSPHSAKEQAEALKKLVKLEPIKRHVGGADDVVAVFEKSIGSSRALAKTVSDRADVVLYGSEMSERFVGGAKVRETLEKWDLAIKVTGLHAGVASKHVAFVAANLEASVGKGKPSPYRLLAIYEKTDTWKVVQLQFSFPLVFD
jgi:hypothetical protein